MKNRHRGLRAYRLAGKSNRDEKALAETWTAHNERGNTLAHLLDDRKVQTGRPPEPSDRDCVVAATVIQWLGTEVGSGFLRELGYEKKADKGEKST